MLNNKLKQRTCQRTGNTFINRFWDLVKWRSKGIKYAADTINLATGQDYERRIRKATNKVYGNCAKASGASLFMNPIMGLGAGAFCIENAALYEFGARGGEEKMNDALEGIGLFIDVSDSVNLIEEGSSLVAIKIQL